MTCSAAHLNIAGVHAVIDVDRDADRILEPFRDLRIRPFSSPPAATFKVCSRDDRWTLLRDGNISDIADTADVLASFLQWELDHLVIDQATLPIHAAAVHAFGETILIVGESHSGKTTLAAMLATQPHAELVAEEVAAIDSALHPTIYPRPFGIRSGGPVALRAGVPYGTERLICASSIGAQVAEQTRPVSMIVFPERSATQTETTVTHLSAAAAMMRLCVSTTAISRHGAAAFRRIEGLAKTASALLLGYSEAVDAIVAIAESAQSARLNR